MGYVLTRSAFLVFGFVAAWAFVEPVPGLKLEYVGAAIVGIAWTADVCLGAKPAWSRREVALGLVLLTIVLISASIGRWQGSGGALGDVAQLGIGGIYLASHRREDSRRRWLLAFGLGAATSVIASMVLIKWMPVFQQELFETFSEGVRFRGFVSNPNMEAGLLLLGMPGLVLWLSAEGTSLGRRVLGACALAALALGVLMTQSRSALVGLILVLGWGALRIYRPNPIHKRTVHNAAVIVAIAALIGATATLLWSNALLTQNLARFGNRAQVHLLDIGAGEVKGERGRIFQAGVSAIMSRPWGYGYGEGARRYVVGVLGKAKSPHNFVLKVFEIHGVGGGCIVLVSWLLPVVIVSYRILGRRDSSWRCGFSGRAGAVSLAVYLIHASMHAMLNWVYVGLFWAVTWLGRSPDRAEVGRLSR